MATVFTDPTNGHLGRLDPRIQEQAFWLITVARLSGVPLWISSSTRSVREQRALVDAGRSKSLLSQHLKGLAFDVDVLGFSRDQVPLWLWHELGQVAEQYLGLRWGGRWTGLRDFGHFEVRG